MSASKSSPTHSHGAVPSKHRISRRTKSVCSASSNTSMRLTAIVEDSFQLSPMPSRMSVLNDRTDIQEPGRQSWWNRIGENSRRVTEIMEERDADVVRTINVAEEFDVEVLSQENEHVSVDLPESSDGESIHSIVIERRKMFVLPEDHPQKKAKELIRNKENLVNSQKSYYDKTNNMNIEQDIDVMPKRLFSAVPRPTTKPTFTAALINASANKTVNKSSEKPAQEVQVRNLFSKRPDAKRKNNFAAFLLSDSEDEIPDVRPRMFGFQKTKKIENHQISKQQRISVSLSSVRSSVSNMTDLDIDQWNHLPSSTMLEDQFQLVGTTPSKRTRLSRPSKPRQSEVATRQGNSINKSRNSNQSHKSDEPNQSMKSNRSNVDVHKTKLTEENMQVDVVHNDNFTLVYDDDGEQIFEVPGKGGNRNQNQDVIQEDRKEILQDQNKIQDGTVNAKESEQEIVGENESEEEIEEENKSGQEIVGINESEQEIVEQNESEEEIEEENKSEQEFEEENECDQEIEVEYERDQNIVEKNENDREKQQKVLVIERKEIEEEQNQLLDEMVKETKNQAENKNEREFIEENDSDKESQQEKEENNEEEMKHKKQDDYRSPQIKEKSNYNNPARNDGDENNIVMESVLNKSEQNNSAVHKNNKKEYQKLECREKNAQECGKIDRENANNNKDEQENINSNENEKIDSENVGNIEDVQNTKCPEAVLHDKTMRGESFATEFHPMESAKINGEIVSNNKDQRENINLNENKHEDSENVGNIEDEQDAKSPEVVLHDKNKRGELFNILCHRTSINKSKTLIKDLNIRPSLVPARESIGLTDGSLNSSAEGSGWDSHRTTRKTLRQTFGKDFTPRKSLRTLVMDKTAKRQAQNQNNEKADVSKRQLIELRDRDKRQTNFNDITSKMPLANSTEFPAFEFFQEVSLTSSTREQENSKPAIVNSAKLEERNKEKEQEEELDSGQDKDESIESGRETEQGEEIEPDTEEDEELEQAIERDEEIESDEAQEDEELESHTEQHQTEEIESDCEQNLSEEIDSNREYDQTKDIESDEEQQPDEEESNRGEELVDELESYRESEETIEESDDEISIKSSRDKSLETNVPKIIRENAEKRRKIEEQVMNSLKQGRKPFTLFKMPEVPKQICISKIKKPTKGKPKGSPFFTGTLPPEFMEDMKYKPPKRFTGKNAPWITKRLYKYLEEKLQPKYDYRARVRAERLVEKLYHFAKDARKLMVAPRDAVNDLKREMATLGIVNTHYDFYCFFHDFMPREIRIRVNPDILNKIPADKRVFGDILSDDEA